MVKITDLPPLPASAVNGTVDMPVVHEDESYQAPLGRLAGYHGRSYATFAARETIPMEDRYNGLTVWVMEGGMRPFVWITAGTINPMTGVAATISDWVGLYTQRELKNLGIDFTDILASEKVAALPETLGAVDTLATIDICDFRAVAQTSGTNPTTALSWSAKGVLPSAFYLSWGASLITLAGTARGFVPKDWAAIKPLFIIGNSLSDTSDRTDGWPQLLAADRAVGLFSAARYSSDASQVYRCGAESLYLTLAGGSLPAGGTSASVTLINGAAPSANLSVNPASFLNTGDPAITTNVSMTGTIVAGTFARRGTVSIPHGASTAYSIVQDAGGAAIALTGPVLFIPDLAQKMATSDLLMWPGNNYFFSGVSNSYGDYTNPQMWVDMAKMVAKADGNRVLILPLIPDSGWTARGAGTPYTAMLSANARTEALYPAYIARDAAGRTLLQRLQAAGNGLANDNADIAAGFVPRSLRILISAGVWDSLHLNAAGQAVVYAFVKEALARQSLPSPITQSTAFSLRAVGVNPRTDAALESIAVATVQTGPLAALADQVAGSFANAPYRPTLAAAVADLPVDAYFSSRDTAAAGPHAGVRWNYRRIAAAPYWQALDAWAAPQDVGLGNVANIAPEAMPVSAAQQAALNAKADGAETATALATKTNTVDLASASSSKGASLITRRNGEVLEVAATRADLAAARVRKMDARHYLTLGDLAAWRAQFKIARYRQDGGVSTRALAISAARSGPATYPPLALPITTYADGVPRITDDGQVVERATTNHINSADFTGAVVGTRTGGGALPTGWDHTSDWEVISVTTVDGAPRLRLKLTRLPSSSSTGPSIKMCLGNFGKAVPAPTRGGWLVHGMMQVISMSGAATGIYLNMLEQNGTNTSPVGGNTAQSPVSPGLTAPGSMTAVRGYRATSGTFISPRLALVLSDATAAYEVVVDITMPQVETAASLEDYTTWIPGARNAETVDAKPAQYDAQLDVFVQGKTSGAWQLARANAPTLSIAPPSGGVIAQASMLAAGTLTDIDDRASYVEALAPATFALPTNGIVQGDPATPVLRVAFGGRDFVAISGNGRLLDGAKPWCLKIAGNRGASIRFEVRQGDTSWIETASGRTDVERCLMSSGWASFLSSYGEVWQTQYTLTVEPGAVNPNTGATWFLLTQWHSPKVDADITFSPPQSLQIVTLGGVEYLAVNISHTTQKPIATPPPGGLVWTDTAPLVRGKRYHIVERILWNHGATTGGIYQLWMWDVDAGAWALKCDHAGPVGYNQDQPPYWDFGIYRASAPNTVAVRFDNVKPMVVVAAGSALPSPVEVA